MTSNRIDGNDVAQATPFVHEHSTEIQPYGHLVRLPIGLSRQPGRQRSEINNPPHVQSGTSRIYTSR